MVRMNMPARLIWLNSSKNYLTYIPRTKIYTEVAKYVFTNKKNLTSRALQKLENISNK